MEVYRLGRVNEDGDTNGRIPKVCTIDRRVDTLRAREKKEDVGEQAGSDRLGRDCSERE